MKTGLFAPSKRSGLIFHGSLLVALGAISAWAVWKLSGSGPGALFAAYLVLGILAFAPMPLLAYRAYALFRALYRLDRDGLELRWGLRDEVIPLSDIEWVRSPSDLARPIVLPSIRLPGAVLGLRRHEDLGVVEFLASNVRDLLLVATPRRVYAISPADPAGFADIFARAVELGSLRTAKSRSLYPSFVFSQAWRAAPVRFMWLATLFLNVGLVIWISLLIPSSARFALGFGPDRTPAAVPSVQLVILPLVSAFFSLLCWGSGLFFFRWGRRKILAMILWGSSVVSSLAFLMAVLFIVGTPV